MNKQEVTCTAKKFTETYSYIYETKEECLANGSIAFSEVSNSLDDTIFSYGCLEIIDDCQTTWYGVYFNKSLDGEIIRVYH